MSWAVSYDAPVIRNLTCVNVAASGRHSMSVVGRGFGLSGYSVGVRVGVSACGMSTWVSDSSVACAVQGGAGGTLGSVVSAGVQVGTTSAVVSYDAVGVNGSLAGGGSAVSSNVGGSGGSVVSLSGVSMGRAEYSGMSRVGGSACASTEWRSDSVVLCGVCLLYTSDAADE